MSVELSPSSPVSIAFEEDCIMVSLKKTATDIEKQQLTQLIKKIKTAEPFGEEALFFWDTTSQSLDMDPTGNSSLRKLLEKDIVFIVTNPQDTSCARGIFCKKADAKQVADYLDNTIEIHNCSIPEVRRFQPNTGDAAQDALEKTRRVAGALIRAKFTTSFERAGL